MRQDVSISYPEDFEAAMFDGDVVIRFQDDGSTFEFVLVADDALSLANEIDRAYRLSAAFLEAEGETT